ncbi:MAG: helicase-related protein [Candidatus Pacebacteria bacterium]|nr:helicase-related protein [Candidatus Paceibacterota bacterium]
MDLASKKALQSALIVSITPYFLEKEILWFTENLSHIKKSQKTQAFWQDNTLFLEANQKINISEVLKKIDEMGYEKVFKITEPGEFSQIGGVVEIFPINSFFAFRLDFLGNTIETIEKLPIEITNEETAKNVLKKKLKSQKIFSDLKGLKTGDYLVHLDHGISRFLEIQTVQESEVAETFSGASAGERAGFEHSERASRGQERVSALGEQAYPEKVSATSPAKEYYVLEYAQGDKLFVPVGLERKLTRYLGFVEPKLSRLGGIFWQKTKYKIKEDAEKFAKELLEMFALKELATRPAYSKTEIYEKLEATFPYTLTPDQSQCLNEIENDFSKQKPIDRIICGDVGFGKTEVALRAATLAAENSKQAVIMCPTTILATQHFNTFQKRLTGLPVKVALLSRLQNKNEKPKILQGLKDGNVDILIATHSVLAKNIEFKNLGLLIIDDEQRFGVKQKEKLRTTNPSIDILYLSATPIPRTLYLALSSLKEISFIQTPPQGRKPVKTFILPFKKDVIKNAIENELKRGGQIYFLHNRVETINAFKLLLEELLNKKPSSKSVSICADRPTLIRFELEKSKVKIGVLHAKLPDKEIVKALSDFQTGKTNLLLATTIIENGLDISNANTLIVDNATRLGLAQAYQLRGRIGRSNTQANAYFLYPKNTLKGLAKQRLTALKQAEELGSGYKIAQADLEIRGAGNILGREQSGSVNRIGLNLYCQMLSEAVEKLKKNDY